MGLDISISKRKVVPVFEGYITHNLIKMAKVAGLYEVLWRPEELNITKARQLIRPLKNGLKLLKSNPEKFKKLNPENGWGSYEALIEVVENYLNACIEDPTGIIRVNR